jgi:hypothetical protein
MTERLAVLAAKGKGDSDELLQQSDAAGSGLVTVNSCGVQWLDVFALLMGSCNVSPTEPQNAIVDLTMYVMSPDGNTQYCGGEAAFPAAPGVACDISTSTTEYPPSGAGGSVKVNIIAGVQQPGGGKAVYVTVTQAVTVTG